MINKIRNSEPSTDDLKTVNVVRKCKLHTVILEGFRIERWGKEINAVSYKNYYHLLASVIILSRLFFILLYFTGAIYELRRGKWKKISQKLGKKIHSRG
jgi:hypothetical protein